MSKVLIEVDSINGQYVVRHEGYSPHGVYGTYEEAVTAAEELAAAEALALKRKSPLPVWVRGVNQNTLMPDGKAKDWKL